MSLAVDLRKFAQKYKLRMEEVAQAVPLELTRRVVLASPVDTGRFRANWNVATNRADLATTEDTDESGSSAINRAAAVRVKLGDDVYVTNNLPYAQPLEEGSSDQAPHGMVATSIKAFEAATRKAVRDAKSKHR